MNPGDVAEDGGSIWFLAFGDGPILTPNMLGKMDFGIVFVTQDQARAAEPYGWTRAKGWPHDSLVAIERSAADAIKIRRRASALSDLAALDGETL